MKDRPLNVRFTCAECGEECLISCESELFDLVESQVCGETRQLHCWECIE